jgi:hypothetical protein
MCRWRQKMPKLNYLPELELQVRMAMDVPEPNAKTMDALREQFISRGKATLKPDPGLDSASHPFRPEKENKMKPTSSRFSPRLAWGMALIVVAILLTLALTSPTVVNALRRLLGYIPDVGVVEQRPSILVLAEPVIVERNGVTLSVEQAISTPEKTIVIYRHVEEPLDSVTVLPENYVDDRPTILLPDGNKLDMVMGSRQPSDGMGILYALDFPPLPAGVTEVTLELTRLAGLLPGQGPENWEIPIRFKESDPSLMMYPVVEYAPSPTVVSPDQPNEPIYGISITLDKSVDLPDGYLLMGSSQWTDSSIPQYYITTNILSVTDVNGQNVEFEFADPEMYPQPDELRQYWAYKITSKNFAPPLNLNFYVQIREIVDANFQFDPGSNPQDGQTWDLNIDVPVNGHVVKVISAQYHEFSSNKTFDFTMTADVNVTYAEIIPLPRPLFGGGGGGGGSPQTNSPFTSGFSFEGEIPADGLTLSIIGLDVLVPGDWTVMWNPPASTQQSVPVPTPQLLSACLTKESWQQALKSRPPLPADLTGKLALAESTGEIVIADLSDGTQKVAGKGDAPSFSPNGSRVVVVGPAINSQPPDGLYIIDLASGTSTYLPSTTPTDGNPIWSPDGTKIAFTRRPAGSTDESDPTAIMVVNPDGSDLRQLTPFDGVRIVTAWMPDSSQIVYIARYGLRNASASLLNIETGDVSEMFGINYGYGSVDISPDGKQAVYENWLPGDIYALFTSSIDGINQRLLAQGPETTVVIPKWSPDGRWIIATIYEGNSDGMLALIQVDTCQIIPLQNLSGYVGSWIP